MKFTLAVILGMGLTTSLPAQDTLFLLPLAGGPAVLPSVRDSHASAPLDERRGRPYRGRAFLILPLRKRYRQTRRKPKT